MTGGENHVRVLSAVMDAVIPLAASFLLMLLRSVSDEAHDAARHYDTRFSWQHPRPLSCSAYRGRHVGSHSLGYLAFHVIRQNAIRRLREACRRRVAGETANAQ